jgi:hypothetical protein
VRVKRPFALVGKRLVTFVPVVVQDGATYVPKKNHFPIQAIKPPRRRHLARYGDPDRLARLAVANDAGHVQGRSVFADSYVKPQPKRVRPQLDPADERLYLCPARHDQPRGKARTTTVIAPRYLACWACKAS